MIRYYITDSRTCSGDLLDNIEKQAREGVDYIQLREKDLSANDLFLLSKAALERLGQTRTRLLVNERADIAMLAGAHGVHLRSNPIPPATWKTVLPDTFLISVSCHTEGDIREAQDADLILFGPVFETPDKGPPIGLEALRSAVSISRVPLLALGGITRENAGLCVATGASGIAAIRLFQR